MAALGGGFPGLEISCRDLSVRARAWRTDDQLGSVHIKTLASPDLITTDRIYLNRSRSLCVKIRQWIRWRSLWRGMLY